MHSAQYIFTLLLLDPHSSASDEKSPAQLLFWKIHENTTLDSAGEIEFLESQDYEHHGQRNDRSKQVTKRTQLRSMATTKAVPLALFSIRLSSEVIVKCRQNILIISGIHTYSKQLSTQVTTSSRLASFLMRLILAQRPSQSFETEITSALPCKHPE